MVWRLGASWQRAFSALALTRGTVAGRDLLPLLAPPSQGSGAQSSERFFDRKSPATLPPTASEAPATRPPTCLAAVTACASSTTPSPSRSTRRKTRVAELAAPETPTETDRREIDHAVRPRGRAGQSLRCPRGSGAARRCGVRVQACAVKPTDTGGACRAWTPPASSTRSGPTSPDGTSATRSWRSRCGSAPRVAPMCSSSSRRWGRSRGSLAGRRSKPRRPCP